MVYLRDLIIKIAGDFIPSRDEEAMQSLGEMRVALLEALEDTKESWIEGFPARPWNNEWFIAHTTYGDRVVLKALPEEYAYDFKTADDTYIKRENIAKWMPFPDSDYIDPRMSPPRSVDRL